MYLRGNTLQPMTPRIAIGVAIALLVAQPSPAAFEATPPIADTAQRLEAMPDAEGKRLLTAACGGCHGLDVTLGSRKNAIQWRTTIHDMISRGAQIFPEEVDVLVAYLAEHLGP